MPRTEEVEWWYAAVYSAVQQIPFGRVTTYGHIAELLGHPRRARQVGICLKHLPSRPPASAGDGEGEGEAYHADNVPWQRVINSKGMISHRGPGSAARQAERLREEGVTVNEDAMGEFYIDLKTYGWFPEELPEEP